MFSPAKDYFNTCISIDASQKNNFDHRSLELKPNNGMFVKANGIYKFYSNCVKFNFTD